MKKIFLLFSSALLFSNFSIAQTETSPVSNPKVTCMAFTPNDQKMVSGCDDGSIQVWNAQGQLLFNKKVSTDKRIVMLAISPDGKEFLLMKGFVIVTYWIRRAIILTVFRRWAISLIFRRTIKLYF